jgi:hypothetical protein
VNKNVINLRLFINSTIESIFHGTKFVDLQFIFIKLNYFPDQLLTDFDIDITQFSFDGQKLCATMAAIEAIRTKCIINYSLNNDDKDYAPMAIRISKYVKHGFYLLIPKTFNSRRFEASPTHISNKDIRLHHRERVNNEYRIHVPMLGYQFNNNNDYEYGNLVWSRNFDCFSVQ